MLSCEQVEQGIKDLPPLSPVVVDILNMLNSTTEVDFDELEKKLLQDPGLTGRMLGLANSAFFGMQGEVSSMKDACLILGINAIKNLVVSSAMIQQFPLSSKINLDIKGVWLHSIATASAAKVMARYTSLDPEVAFTTGLLHDIGKMILDMHFTQYYQQVIEYQHKKQCLIQEAEDALLECDHGEVGAMVARHWKLPNDIVQTIEDHHRDLEYQVASFSHLVILADFISRGLALGYPGDDFIPLIEEDVLKVLNVTVQDIADSLAEIEALYDGLTSMLD